MKKPTGSASRSLVSFEPHLRSSLCSLSTRLSIRDQTIKVDLEARGKGEVLVPVLGQVQVTVAGSSAFLHLLSEGVYLLMPVFRQHLHVARNELLRHLLDLMFRTRVSNSHGRGTQVVQPANHFQHRGKGNPGHR